MNSDEEGKITQNLKYLKRHLIDLDPIIDTLIQEYIFHPEDREKIESLSTTSKQFNKFISLLTRSPRKETFQVFIEALKEEKYGDIAQKLQNTPPREGHKRSTSSRNKQHPSMLVADDASGASGVAQATRTNNNSNCAGAIKTMLEKFGKQQKKMFETLENEHQEEMNELEKGRIQDNEVSQERMRELLKQWKTDKQDIIRSNEMKIDKLQTEINDFLKRSDEFNSLKEEYDHLKQQQEGLKAIDDGRKKRLEEIEKKSEEYKNNREKLNTELEHVKQNLREIEKSNQSMKDHNRNRDEEISQLENEKRELEEQLKNKDEQKEDLKNQLHQQFLEIKNLFNRQREESKIDDSEFDEKVDEQKQQVDAIYSMMKNISRDNGKKPKHKTIQLGWKQKYTD